MNKYLSLIFLYNRAGRRKLLLAVCAVPLLFAAVFLLRTGDPRAAEPYMLIEHAFGGMWAVIAFVAVMILGLMASVNSLNGRKALKASHSTTGYTIRRLRQSPTSSFLTVFIYYLALILIFWGAALVSLYIIGRLGLSMAGAQETGTKLALGLLRTDLGQALIPMANPTLILFNAVSVLALAAECAKSSYLSWHNGRPSYGVLLTGACMFLVWSNILADVYIFMTVIIIAVYAVVSCGDVIAREKHPKGDPFKANQYAGIMDLDGFEFDDSSYAPEANGLLSAYGSPDPQKSVFEVYGRRDFEVYDRDDADGRDDASGRKRKRLSFGLLRRRFMPLGINLERANALLGACIFTGIAGNLLFVFKYITAMNVVKAGIKGATIAAGVKMPYFWELQDNAYYGYAAAILIAFFLQSYWNYEYYNKKTKSVYVMKRLPDRREYARTIWVAPTLQSLFIAFIMLVQTLIDLGIYVLATPHVALHADYLARIISF